MKFNHRKKEKKIAIKTSNYFGFLFKTVLLTKRKFK